jgi:hypothetical protein
MHQAHALAASEKTLLLQGPRHPPKTLVAVRRLGERGASLDEVGASNIESVVSFALRGRLQRSGL